MPGLDINCMDHSADPRNDFYAFANGKWEQNNPIPGEHARWGNFTILSERVLMMLKEICERMVSETSANELTDQYKVGIFWTTAMDEVKADAIGCTPLEGFMKAIDAVTSKDNLAELVGELHRHGIPCLFDFSVVPDFKDSSMNRLFVSQGGLGMPDRDYYLLDEKKEIKDKYIKHVASTFQLFGLDEGDAIAASKVVIRIETALAEKSRTKTLMRDLPSLYNPVNMVDLDSYDWPWKKYFATLQYNYESAPFVNLAVPEFLGSMNDVVSDIGEAKQYAKWHVLRNMAPYLSDAFVQEDFAFQQVITGIKELKPRWKRIIACINGTCGELLGKVYCAEKFPPEAKYKCAKMVEGLRKALKEILNELEWMHELTKKKALEKLTLLRVKVGYPDQWEDYNKLNFDGSSYAAHVLAANSFQHGLEMARVDKPVDPLRWEMEPQTVNAYYHPLRNEIVFPAAILQSPAFDSSRADALNYGAIGAIIGHEITHGFDDQGRLFDSQGNMTEWWQPTDSKKFNELAQRAIDQYSALSAFGKSVNGNLTQGENIADIGGVKIALRALKNLWAEEGKPEGEDGFTPEQLFFLSWAQFWATIVREEEGLRLLTIDPHSPARLRASAPLQNVEEFYEAFGVVEGDAMFLTKDKRVKIWG